MLLGLVEIIPEQPFSDESSICTLFNPFSHSSKKRQHFLWLFARRVSSSFTTNYGVVACATRPQTVRLYAHILGCQSKQADVGISFLKTKHKNMVWVVPFFFFFRTLNLDTFLGTLWWLRVRPGRQSWVNNRKGFSRFPALSYSAWKKHQTNIASM